MVKRLPPRFCPTCGHIIREPYIFSWKKVIRNWLLLGIWVSASLAMAAGVNSGSVQIGLAAFGLQLLGMGIIYLIGFCIYKLSKKFS